MRINEGFNDELFFELLGVANYYFQAKNYHVCVGGKESGCVCIFPLPLWIFISEVTCIT